MVVYEKSADGVLEEADLISTPTRETAIARAREASSKHGGALALMELEGWGRRVIASFGAVWD